MKNSKVVVITGGMGGIGKAIAKRLSDEGFRIFIIYNKNPKEEVDLFINSLKGAGHLASRCDITDEKLTKKILAKGEEKMGRIDIGIHCAVSSIVRKKATTISPAQFKKQFEVTTFGGLIFFQNVLLLIKKQDCGKIIGLTSSLLNSSTLESSMAGYLCAKEALSGILRDLSKELVDDKITVNAVAPLFVDTPLQRDLPETVVSFIKNRSKTNTVDEVAEVVSFLCSEKADNITGKVYPVINGEITSL